MTNRFMRIIVLFDLPVADKRMRLAYTRFRRFLLRDGYDMLQFSVYCRLCNGFDATQKHLQRLKYAIPAVNGSVRALMVTDKQYVKMHVLLGKKTRQEKYITPKQLTLF